ncbi:MAG: hypothetical protein HYX92_15845 [Chloroflexi bacterium]|nr:hypothetical protein [Chloroflexota bacterium]
MATIEVVSPLAEVRPDVMTAAPRPASLTGKKIALWWNSKPRGDAALTAIAEALERRFPGLEFAQFSQQYDWGRHFPERYDEVKQSGCQVAIVTNGD